MSAVEAFHKDVSKLLSTVGPNVLGRDTAGYPAMAIETDPEHRKRASLSKWCIVYPERHVALLATAFLKPTSQMLQWVCDLHTRTGATFAVDCFQVGQWTEWLDLWRMLGGEYGSEILTACFSDNQPLNTPWNERKLGPKGRMFLLLNEGEVRQPREGDEVQPTLLLAPDSTLDDALLDVATDAIRYWKSASPCE